MDYPGIVALNFVFDVQARVAKLLNACSVLPDTEIKNFGERYPLTMAGLEQGEDAAALGVTVHCATFLHTIRACATLLHYEYFYAMLPFMMAKNDTRKRRLNQRRKLLRDFRKRYGLTLTRFGKATQLSFSMLAQFERGERDLSPQAWQRVQDAIKKFPGERSAETVAQVAEAGKIMAQLTELAQQIHSPTLAEMLLPYMDRYAGLSSPPLGALKEDALNLFEIATRAVNEANAWRHKLQSFEEHRRTEPDAQRAERAEAQKENIEKFVEQHLPQIATGEAAKLAEKDKELALSKEAQRDEMRRLGFKDE